VRKNTSLPFVLASRNADSRLLAPEETRPTHGLGPAQPPARRLVLVHVSFAVDVGGDERFGAGEEQAAAVER